MLMYRKSMQQVFDRYLLVDTMLPTTGLFTMILGLATHALLVFRERNGPINDDLIQYKSIRLNAITHEILLGTWCGSLSGFRGYKSLFFSRYHAIYWHSDYHSRVGYLRSAEIPGKEWAYQRRPITI